MTSSFLSGFKGLWRRPKDHYERGVQGYLVVVDTNVLLELYRFTPDARNELLDVLQKLGQRLWIPHQVASEYYARRVDAVKEHLALYSSVPGSLEDARKKSVQVLQTFARRCAIQDDDKKRLIDPIEAAFSAAIAEIEKHKESFDLDLAKVVSADPVLDALAEIANEKTGYPFNVDERDALLGEFKTRVESGIPPGYRDAAKSDNPHGDFFIWEQTLREASERQTPVLFVTNDAKDDWVRREAGVVVGPRPELIQEFKERCDQDFLLMDLGHFLKVAKEKLGAAVSASTVAQAENVQHPSAGVILRGGVLLSAEEHYIIEADLVDFAQSWEDILVNSDLDTAAMTRIREMRSYSLNLLATLRSADKQKTSDGVVYFLDDVAWLDIMNVLRRSKGYGMRVEGAIEFAEKWNRLATLEGQQAALRDELAEAEDVLKNCESLFSRASGEKEEEAVASLLDRAGKHRGSIQKRLNLVEQEIEKMHGNMHRDLGE